MVSSILNRSSASTACGTFAGMMTISPAETSLRLSADRQVAVALDHLDHRVVRGRVLAELLALRRMRTA